MRNHLKPAAKRSTGRWRAPLALGLHLALSGIVLLTGATDSLAQPTLTAVERIEPAPTNRSERLPSGASFVVPTGWVQWRGASWVVLEAPDGGSWVALIETDAENAADALAQAWQRYAGGPAPVATMTAPLANQQGWLDGQSHQFPVVGSMPRQLSARVMRSGDRWVARIDDLASAVAGKRGAELSLIRDEFLPAGYVRERFDKRKAHKLNGTRIDALRAFLRESQQQLAVPGISVGLVQGGKVVLAEGFGVREIGRPETVDADTLYLIASNTKPLTSLMLAKLIHEGKFEWTSRVSALMPDFQLADPDLARRFEVRHLACACAGLPYRNLDWEFAETDAPAAIVFDILRRMRPTSAFGRSYQYSNPPAAAAGYLGGHVAYPHLELGAAYDRAMATRVFKPLGMTRTSFDFDVAMRGNFARSHGVDIDGHLALIDPRRDRQMRSVRPTGGAWSNVNDLLSYLKVELRGGRLDDGRRYLPSAAIRQRWKSQVATGRRAWYGLGLDTDVSTGTPMMFHGGRLYGQRSNLVWWPDHDVGLVILMNSSTGNVLMDAFPRKVVEVLFDGAPEADSMVAAAAASERIRHNAWRRSLSFPAESQHTALLASLYRNAHLGALQVERDEDQTRFRFAAWDAPIASRENSQGETEFVLAIPSPPPPFVFGTGSEGTTLTLRDAQNTYVFEEVRSGD